MRSVARLSFDPDVTDGLFSVGAPGAAGERAIASLTMVDTSPPTSPKDQAIRATWSLWGAMGLMLLGVALLLATLFSGSIYERAPVSTEITYTVRWTLPAALLLLGVGVGGLGLWFAPHWWRSDSDKPRARRLWSLVTGGLSLVFVGLGCCALALGSYCFELRLDATGAALGDLRPWKAFRVPWKEVQAAKLVDEEYLSWRKRRRSHKRYLELSTSKGTHRFSVKDFGEAGTAEIVSFVSTHVRVTVERR